MISFKQFINEEIEQKIVILHCDSQTSQNLRNYCQENKFDITKTYSGKDTKDFDFHLILICSENKVFLPEEEVKIDILTKAIKFQELGQNQKHPTIILDATKKLNDLRQYFEYDQNLKPTFPFKPHITLSYNWFGDPVLKDLKLPGFPIKFNRMVCKKFDPQ